MKKLLVLIGLIITCAIFFPIQASGQTPESYKFSSITAQTYFRFLDGYSWPTSASGVFTDTISNSNVISSDYDQFQIPYIHNVCIPKPWPLEGCLWQHDYGAVINLDFNTRGAVKYTYTIPFTANFRFPRDVYPGQIIQLAPNFRWSDTTNMSNPTIQTIGNYEFYFISSTMVDAPFDGLDDLSASFTQYASKAHLNLQLPVFPFAPALSMDGDCTQWFCATGGGEWGGSYTKLGGTGTLSMNSPAGSVFNVTPTDVSIGFGLTSDPAWKQGHEQFELVQTVLGYIPHPATQIASQMIGYARNVGQFKLYTQLDGSIYREDYVHFQFSSTPTIKVPETQANPWTFKEKVTVKYRVQGCSSFSYPMGYNVIYDMIGIDPQTLLHEDLISIFAGETCTDWLEKEGSFYISGSVPVVKKEQYPVRELILEPYMLSDFKIPLYKVSSIPSPFKPGIKVASLTDTKRTIRLAVRVPFPVPTIKQGIPAKGQYTVVLGTTSQLTAEQIIKVLQSKGISGFIVTVPGYQYKMVTLGSFANRSDAQQLSNMLKEAYRVESSVVQIIDSKSYVPIKSDVLTKLSK